MFLDRALKYLLIFASIFLLLVMLLLLLYTYHLFSDYLVGVVNISSKSDFSSNHLFLKMLCVKLNVLVKSVHLYLTGNMVPRVLRAGYASLWWLIYNRQ